MARPQHIAMQRGLVEGQRIDGAQPPVVQRGIRRSAAQQQVGQDQQQAEDDERHSARRSGHGVELRPIGQRAAPVFAGQRVQKASDQFDFPPGQHPAELASCHLLDRLLEGLGPAIVEIGSRDGHVAQARNAEDEPVIRLAGDGETAEVGGADGPLRERVVKDAEPLKQIAADIDALMAGDAADSP